MAINAVTGEEYQGKNALILSAVAADYPSAEFLTFKQALAIGRCVRRGEHGTPIMKIVEKTLADGSTKKVPKGYTVFNLAQTDPLPNAAQEGVTA